MHKAIALLSGGLDSTLAIKLMQEQGIDIVALHFTTPFCQCGGSKDGCKATAHTVAENFKIPIKTINNTDEFFKILKHPKHGYGSHMNPCIDCRILMLQTTQKYMAECGASFVVTGEVLGQRPMSQHRQSLDLIERESGLAGLILRPLSAQWLEITIPEKEGWVDRAKLLDIKGRSRKPQMSLANSFEIKDYPCPAGGCLLTDPSFSLRVKDLLQYSDLILNDVLLLKAGRHFRLDRQTKLIVGRNDGENNIILSLVKESDVIIDMRDCPGPAGLLRGDCKQSNLDLACRITARYADSKPGDAEVTAEIRINNILSKKIKVMPFGDKEVKGYII